MTTGQTATSDEAKGVPFGANAYWGQVTVGSLPARHTVSSVSAVAMAPEAYVVETATQGFITPPNIETEAEWRKFRALRPVDPAYAPARTPLGAELRRLRRKIIESGEPLLDWDQIEKEVSERRGDRERQPE